MGLLGRLLQGLLRRTQQYVLRRAEPVVAISREVEGKLLDLGVASTRIARIPNGIDLSRFHPVSADEKLRLRAQLSIPQQATVVLFAGRLSKAKGIVRLLELWPEIMARHPRLHLVIVGSGAGSFDDCEAELTDLIQQGQLQPHVTMAGATDRVQSYLQAADVFMFPSLYEGFGLGIIEALACGMIVAVTPVGVAEELIQHGENGFLFRADDSAAILGAMDAVLASKDSWPAISRRARAAIEPFDLDAIVGQYAALCQTTRP
jgi:glycosyltransferase involved in cell wall biosynthesis